MTSEQPRNSATKTLVCSADTAATICNIRYRSPYKRANMKKSPTKYELAGVFLAHVKIYLYLCSGFENT